MDNGRNSAEENLAPPFVADIGHSIGQPPPQYECPICLHWLQDPLLTTCGHRFCKGCITAWLQQGGHCPVDNVSLKNVDLFPDNYTKREILQQSVTCPYSSNGCTAKIGPLELESHVAACNFKRLSTDASPKNTIFCPFKPLGCRPPIKNEERLTLHLESEMQSHLNLLMNAYNKLTIDKEMGNLSFDGREQESDLWTPSEKQPTTSNADSRNNDDRASVMSSRALIRALYERIVILEQRNHEQDITIGNLSRFVNSLSNSHKQLSENLHLKYCFGTFVWKIENFTSKLELLLKDPTKMLYSQGFYSSPNGYRFCSRLNASPIQPNSLALHIHLMKSENDECLVWPFKGRISLSLINSTFPQMTQSDTMESRPELLAFQRPTSEMCTRGFGFASYISADDLKYKGYIATDCLKVQIKVLPS